MLRRPWIDPHHRRLSIQQQCELLGVPRSTYYHQPLPESAENLVLLRKLDQLYLKRPFFGSRKMAVELKANRKRIQRLMRILGIEAHYPKPNLSRPGPGHEVYPYLLRGVTIERPNHVWSTDITYLPMRGGFLYYNVFIERLWRSAKDERIYPGDFATGLELFPALENYFHFYNHQRPHQALGYQTPADFFPHKYKSKS